MQGYDPRCIDFGTFTGNITTTKNLQLLLICSTMQIMRFLRKTLYNNQHVIHTYLPERSDIVYMLHTRRHNKNLIPKTNDLNDRHFLIRLLYKDCYQVIFV